MKKIKSIILGVLGIFFFVFLIVIQLLGLVNIFPSIASVGLPTLLAIIIIIFIIVTYNSNQKKKQSQEKIFFVINERKKETKEEINRIETEFDSIEQRLEEVDKEEKALISSYCDCELDIERLKKENFTPENKAEIKKLSKLCKTISEDISRNRDEEAYLKNELKLLGKSLGGYKSALHSIKEIEKTIERYKF